LKKKKGNKAAPLQMLHYGYRWLDKYQWATAGHAQVQEDVVLYQAKPCHTTKSHSFRGDVLRRRFKAWQKEIKISEMRCCK